MSAETEQQTILQMVADGSIRADEATRLLSAISDSGVKPKGAASPMGAHTAAPAKQEPERKTSQTVDIVRPDGSHYAMEVPASLAPAVMKLVGVYMKESARTASQETWQGLKVMAANKADEIRAAVKGRVSGGNAHAQVASAADTLESNRRAARRRVLDMIQNGRLNAESADRLIDQIDRTFVAEEHKLSR